MLLAFLGEQYWFIPPVHSLRIAGNPDVAGAIVYFLVSLTIVIFADTIRRTTSKLATTSEKLRETGVELSRSHAELEQRVSERTKRAPANKRRAPHTDGRCASAFQPPSANAR